MTDFYEIYLPTAILQNRINLFVELDDTLVNFQQMLKNKFNVELELKRVNNLLISTDYIININQVVYDLIRTFNLETFLGHFGVFDHDVMVLQQKVNSFYFGNAVGFQQLIRLESRERIAYEVDSYFRQVDTKDHFFAILDQNSMLKQYFTDYLSLLKHKYISHHIVSIGDWIREPEQNSISSISELYTLITLHAKKISGCYKIFPTKKELADDCLLKLSNDGHVLKNVKENFWLAAQDYLNVNFVFNSRKQHRHDELMVNLAAGAHQKTVLRLLNINLITKGVLLLLLIYALRVGFV